MAFIIADLSEEYFPKDGEGQIRLTLVRTPVGFAMKAVTMDGRDVGRWVSDCPLTVTLSAMLWLGQSPWKISQTRDSLPLQRILDEVQGLAPRSAHPQMAIDVLRKAFPPKPTESMVTGAQIEIDVPEPLTLDARHRARGRMEVEAADLPKPSASQALPAPASVDHGGVDPVGLEAVLREAIRSLRAPVKAREPGGEVYAAPVSKLFRSLGVQAHPDVSGIQISRAVELINGLIGQVKLLQAGASALVAYEGTLKLLGMQKLSEVEATVEDELKEIDEEISAAEASIPEAGSEPVLRPLLPGEIPKNLTPDQIDKLESMAVDDPSVRNKLSRTHERAARENERINRVLAAKAEAAARMQVVEVATPTEVAEAEPAAAPTSSNEVVLRPRKKQKNTESKENSTPEVAPPAEA